MARNASLTQMLTDIRNLADTGSATTGRYSDTLLTRLLNQSIQRFREKLSNEGSTHYLVSTSSTLGVGATSPYQFYSLDLSAVSPSIVRIHGVDVVINGEHREVHHVPFTARNSYGGGLVSGEPRAWANYGTRKLAIFPPADSAYTYVVWYLPVLADLSGSDNFDGVAGWEDFPVWDVVCRLVNRDQYPEAYGMFTNQRQEIWADILSSATKLTHAGGAVIGRDRLGARLSGMSRMDRLPPP